MEPTITYARSGDAHIAYTVSGEGPVDVLLLPVEFISFTATHEEPRYMHMLRRLESFARVIRFDRRGVGLSDPLTTDSPPDLENATADILAVLDAAGCERVAIVAWSGGGLHGMHVAATRADRVSKLILINSYPRALAAPDFPMGIPQEAAERFVASARPGQQDPIDTLANAAPSASDDPRFRAWWTRAGHQGASPSTASAWLRAQLFSDVRALLPTITVPTIEIHVDLSFITPAMGRYVAEHIPGARYVQVEGRDSIWWVGPADPILDEIEEFITGRRPERERERRLLTVLFTDIVGSTERAAALGDRRWREMLDTHDSIVDRELERHRGHRVKATGDGVLATFESPAAAVRCARAIGEIVEPFGIEIKAGVHTGEVELRGDDVGGIGVHIAARVMEQAGPCEILVSSTVKELASGSGLRFADLGQQELRGVPDPWRLYRVDA